jgi:hypothetical protein
MFINLFGHYTRVILVCLFLTIPFIFPSNSFAYYLGDVSHDSLITAYDAALVGQASVDLIYFSQEQRVIADVSGDGVITAYDAALIAQLAVGLISDFPALGNIFYVDIDSIGGQCFDNNPGTIDKPWCTAVKGFSSACPGDIVYFRQGVYRQTKIIGEWYFSKKATPDKRITFSGYPGETAVITSMQLRNNPEYWTHETGEIYSTSLTRQNYNIQQPSRIPNVSQNGIPLRLMTGYHESGGPDKLTGAGQWVRDVNAQKLYVWAKGGGNPGNYLLEICEFSDGGSDTIQISCTRTRSADSNEADYLTFKNFVFEGGYEVFAVETDHIWLLDSTIRNSYYVGVKAGGAIPDDYTNPDDPAQESYYNSDYGVVQNNDIYYWGASGIDITGGDHWIIRNNKIHDSAFTRDVGPTTGILFKNNNIGSIAEKNILYNISSNSGTITLGGATWGGIKDEGVDLIARNNIIYNCSGNSAFSFAACSNCSFYNNIVVDSTFLQSIVDVRTVSNIDLESHPTFYSNNCKVKNNIFYNNGSSLNYHIAKGNFLGLEIDYNLIDAYRQSYLGDVGQTLTFDKMQARGYEVNSHIGSPLFAHYNGRDFHLQYGSLGIDQGGNLSQVPDDFDGLVRFYGSSSDIGPYER